MRYVAAYNIEKQVVKVLTTNVKQAMHALLHYADRNPNSPEFVASPAPGVIELNPYFVWHFVMDADFHCLEETYTKVPCYKDQQH